MTERNDGGPAFPILKPQNPNFEYCDPGMTLRDWFAGMSLKWAGHGDWFHRDPKHAAERAYKMADAMLEARK